MEAKTHKALAITMSILAGVLLVTVVAGVVVYNKQLKDGTLVKKPASPAAGSSAATSSAPKTARVAINIPAGAKLVPGTFISVPDANAPGGQKVIDLAAYAAQN